ncbi:MAG TPA: GNAT family N-acetyltransferase [Kurthia gibsonii]|nr:GNAT family N-acetyltransferase [Kurthia gibsonii]
MQIRIIHDEIRQTVKQFFITHWGNSEMVVSTGVYHCDQLEGFYVMDEEEIIGLVTYRIKQQEVEIISLDCIYEGKGIGSALLNRVEEVAKTHQLQKISLITTNDNLHAIRFYQKRGYRVTEIRLDAVKRARLIKPTIPLFSTDQIAIQDEWLLEKSLN